MDHRTSRIATIATVVLLTGMAAACGSTDGGARSSTDNGGDLGSLRMMVPADPGGGWDLTARALQEAMKDTGTVDEVEVFNVPNAGGIVGLSQVAEASPEENLSMVMGLVMVGSIITSDSEVTLDDTTPIAQVASEYEVLVVPGDSPYQDLGDFVDALEADPGSVPIAGGSAGGTDQILAGLIAQDIGADATDVNYVAFSGGGAATAAILGGKVDAGISGYSEFAPQIEAGEMRALAVSSPERIEGVDVPTLREGGVDVELANWRGVVAPPDISEDQRDALVAALEEARQSESWQQTLDENHWRDTWMVGEEFEDYISSEEERVQQILSDLGLV